VHSGETMHLEEHQNAKISSAERNKKNSSKRTQRPDSWTKMRANTARQNEEAYISHKGIPVPRKQVVVDSLICCEKCRLKCGDRRKL